MGSTHAVKQLSFSLFLSILRFDFYLILVSFFTFLGPNGLFLGLWKGSKTVWGSTYVVEQLSFSMLTSILTFDFDLIWRLFLSYGVLMGGFGVRVGFDSCLGVYSCS